MPLTPALAAHKLLLHGNSWSVLCVQNPFAGRHTKTMLFAQAGAQQRWQAVPLPLTSAVAVQELLARLAPAPEQAPSRTPKQTRAGAPDQARPRRPAWRDVTDEQVAAPDSLQAGLAAGLLLGCHALLRLITTNVAECRAMTMLRRWQHMLPVVAGAWCMPCSRAQCARASLALSSVHAQCVRSKINPAPAQVYDLSPARDSSRAQGPRQAPAEAGHVTAEGGEPGPAPGAHDERLAAAVRLAPLLQGTRAAEGSNPCPHPGANPARGAVLETGDAMGQRAGGEGKPNPESDPGKPGLTPVGARRSLPELGSPGSPRTPQLAARVSADSALRAAGRQALGSGPSSGSARSVQGTAPWRSSSIVASTPVLASDARCPARHESESCHRNQ